MFPFFSVLPLTTTTNNYLLHHCLDHLPPAKASLLSQHSVAPPGGALWTQLYEWALLGRSHRDQTWWLSLELDSPPRPVFDVNVSLPQFVWFSHFLHHWSCQCAVVSKCFSMQRKKKSYLACFFLMLMNVFPAGESGATVEFHDFYTVINEC